MSLCRRTSTRLRLPRRGRATAVAAALLASAGLLGAGPTSADEACTSTWDGGGGSTYWGNAANWSGDQLPGPSDVACIGPGVRVDLWSGFNTIGALRSDSPLNMPGGSITITGGPGSSSIASTLTISGSGRLVVDGNLSANQTVQTGGAIVGGGRFTTGDFAWNGGSQGGSGVTELIAGGPGLTLGGDGRSLGSQRTLRIAAGAQASWTSGDFELTDSAHLDNAGQLEIRGDQDFIGSGAVGATVVNEPGATIRRTSGKGEVVFGYVLANEGVLDVASGNVTLRSSTPAGGDSNGEFSIASGATLRLEAGQHLTANSQITGEGTLVVAGGSQEIDGPVEVPLIVRGGEARLNSDVRLPSIELRDGVLAGSGTTATGEMRWTTGSLGGKGRTVIEPGGTGLVIDTPQGHAIFDRTLEIAAGAEAQWLDGSLVMQDYARVENKGLLDIRGDLPFPEVCCDYRPLIHNADGGALRKSAGRGTARIPYAFRNDGRVEASSGRLAFGTVENLDGGTLSGGEWVVSATLEVGSGEVRRNESKLVLDGPSSRVQTPSGGDALQALSANAESGSLTVTGGREIDLPAEARDFENAGSVTVGPQSVLRAGASYTQVGGSTTLTDATSRLVAPGTSVDIRGGRLEGAGTVQGSLTNAGVVAPGTLSGRLGPAPGILSVTGDYVQASGGALEAKIAGVGAGAAHDLLDVGRTASLAGDLRIETLGGFVPSPEDEFDLLRHSSVRGEFDQVSGLNPDASHSYWPPQYGESTTSLRRGSEPQASIGDVTVTEGDAGAREARFTVSLSEVPSRAVHLTWATADGSATAPSDYEAGGGTVTIPHGETSAVIAVPVHSDLLHEPDETFHVDLSEPAGASIVVARGTATITDDDPGPDPPADPGSGSDPDKPPTGDGGTRQPPTPPVKRPPKRFPRCVDRLAPLSRVIRPRAPRAKARKRLTLRGRARDRGCARLRSVRVAVARRVKVHGKRRCRWLGTKGRFGRPARCDRPRWLKPRGTTSWRLKLKRPLPRGSYVARSQARDRAGNLERRVRRSGAGGPNAIALRVR